MLLSACAPPLIIFIIGVGKHEHLLHQYNDIHGIPNQQHILATARETPKIAFAPSFPLLSVPSKSIIA